VGGEIEIMDYGRAAIGTYISREREQQAGSQRKKRNGDGIRMLEWM
jgi:hypothetical protein